MEDIFIDLGDSVGISEGSVFLSGDENLLSESETLVGPQGPPGPQGPKGDPGQDGQDGRNATITVGTTTTGNPGTNASVVNTGTESDAVLNFVIPRGEQGVQGIQGEQGEPGEDGAAATIQVGSVTTVSSDYPATVTNSGTTSAAILNFQIPQGIQGEQGVPGQDGQDGQDGAPGQAATIAVGTTSTGAAGTNASVTNSGTSSAAVFNFTIPRGADGQNGQDGQDGQDGAPGQAATIAVGTTTTGAAGTNASVTNSGTSSAAVLNFTIPRGADGQDGQDGQDGAPGAAATVAVGTTTTGAAGTNASVTNSGTSSAAVLNFTIPRGADGQGGIIRTTSDGSRTGIYFEDGTLIAYRKATITGLNISTSWGSLYRGTNADFYTFAPYTDNDFIDQPVVNVSLINEGTSGSCWLSCWENDIQQISGKWAIPIGALAFVRPSNATNISLNLYIIAIGKWK